MDTSGQTTNRAPASPPRATASPGDPGSWRVPEPFDDGAVAPSQTAPGVAARRVYQSPALFRGEREVVIVHRGQEYRLRITKADKLILTK